MSCKFHSAHTSSPVAKTSFYTGPASASQTKKLRKRMCMADLCPCGSVHTSAISCTMLTIHSVQADSPIADTFCLPLQFLHRASLCFTDKETQGENVHGGPFPLHSLAISCTDSPLPKRFSFSSIFMEDQPLLYRSRNSGRE